MKKLTKILMLSALLASAGFCASDDIESAAANSGSLKAAAPHQSDGPATIDGSGASNQKGHYVMLYAPKEPPFDFEIRNPTKRANVQDLRSQAFAVEQKRNREVYLDFLERQHTRYDRAAQRLARGETTIRIFTPSLNEIVYGETMLDRVIQHAGFDSVPVAYLRGIGALTAAEVQHLLSFGNYDKN